MAQGHPTAAAMASFRRSRLPFARPQTLQTFQLLQKLAQLRREKVPQQAQHAPRPQAKATTRPQQWLKGTPRPQEWLLIGVQGCRLPGLKRSKPSKSSKSPPSSARKRYPNKPNTRHARSQKPPQGHSNGSRAPPGRTSCQVANTATASPLRTWRSSSWSVSIWPQGATSRCLRSKRPYVCLAVRLPLSLYSTPPPIRGSAAPGR